MTVLRSALFNVFFFVSTFLLVWPGALVGLIAPERVLGFASAWARLELAALRTICGIRFEVTGREHLPREGPALIAPRHQSAFDTLVWITLLPRCCYVLKRELLSIPLFGGMLRTSGMIAVDREAGGSAIRALVRGAERAIQTGRQIVIFPEGTRGDPGSPLPLQPGVAALASRTNLPVIPVATELGSILGPARLPQAPGHHSYCCPSTHPARHASTRADAAPGSCAALRGRRRSETCGQLCGCSYRNVRRSHQRYPVISWKSMHNFPRSSLRWGLRLDWG